MTKTETIKLTKAQARILEEVRAAGEAGKHYNRRSERAIGVLEALKLVTVARDFTTKPESLIVAAMDDQEPVNGIKYREEWLVALVNKLRPIFLERGHELTEKVRIAIGWPKGTGTKAIGQCFSSSCSGDKTYEVFVSPEQSEPFLMVEGIGMRGIVETVIHELCHVVDGCLHGHKSPFKKIATSMGLTGRMTTTVMTPEMETLMRPIADELGTFPHASMFYNEGRKKGTGRYVKAHCPNCGYVIRTTRKWLEVGIPTCCCGSDMVEG